MREAIPTGRRWYMMSAGAVVWLALILQLYLTVHLARDNGKSVLAGIGVYLRYFTVLTNILVAIALTAPLRARSSRIGRFFARPDVNAAIAAYIIVVGLVYSILLRAVWSPTGLQLVADRLLHDVVPLLFVFYWLVFIPRGYLRWTTGCCDMGLLEYLLRLRCGRQLTASCRRCESAV